MNQPTWWRHLRGDPTRFLLCDDEPGATWRTLVAVLHRPPDSPAVIRARLAARERGAAAAILASRNEFETWGSPAAYGARWVGSAWHLSALAQLGADPDDPRLGGAVEVLLDTLHPAAGGFATARRGDCSPCFTAEMCAALIRLGFRHHPRVREAVAWLSAEFTRGAGFVCRDGGHTAGGGCVVAAVAVLRLLAELPAGERTQLRRFARAVADWVLERDLFVSGEAPRGWLELAHPNLGRSDLLEALAALARIDEPPSRPILAALLGIMARQDGAGCWRQQLRVAFGEGVGERSRWLTIKALTALAAYGDALAPRGEWESAVAPDLPR